MGRKVRVVVQKAGYRMAALEACDAAGRHWRDKRQIRSAFLMGCSDQSSGSKLPIIRLLRPKAIEQLHGWVLGARCLQPKRTRSSDLGHQDAAHGRHRDPTSAARKV
jgi:hypothetical protein